MSKMQRTKGSAAERELARLLHEELGVRLVRNLDQPRGGGHDLDPHPDESGPIAAELRRWAIECKRHARATPALVSAWWTQAQTQAAKACRLPALAYRADRGQWRFVLPLSVLRAELPRWEGIDWTADVSLPAFCALVREGATR